MVVLIAGKGAKPKAEEAEKKPVSDNPVCVSALNAAKLSVKQTQFDAHKDVDRQMQQGALVALAEMKGVADRQETRWWRNEADFDKAVFAMWKHLRETGDMGNVEIKPFEGGTKATESAYQLELDSDYLEGAEAGVKILRKLLSRRWEERKEKEQQLKPMAQDVKREPLITPPPAKAASYSERLEEAHKNDPPQPPSGELPAVKSGSPKWAVEREREEKAKKKDDERSEGHTGGGMRQEE